MTNPTTYRVTFHVSHPHISADGIVASVGLPVRYARSAGAPKLTKSGESLGGNYSRTDVSFLVTDGVQDESELALETCLATAIERIPASATSEVIAVGGKCFFVVGLYTEGNVMCDFDIALLEKLAFRRIALKMDVYGGSE